MTERGVPPADDGPPSVPPSRGTRPWWSRAVALVGVAATVYILARDVDDLRLLRDAEPSLLVANAGLQVLLLFATAATHRFAVAVVSGVRVPQLPWAQLFVTARFLNNVVPQAGNAYRAARLRAEWSVSLTDYVSSYVAFMWLLTTFNFLAATAVLVVGRRDLDLLGLPAELLLGATAAGLLLLPPVVHLLWRSLPAARGRLAWLQGRLQVFLDGSITAFSRPTVLARGAALSLLAASVATSVTWTAFAVLGHRLGLAEVLVFYVIIQLSSFVQVTPGNIGLQEVAFGLLATEFGVPASSGVLASAIIRIIGLAALFLAAVPMGGLAVARRWRAAPPGTAPAGDDGDDAGEAAPRPTADGGTANPRR